MSDDRTVVRSIASGRGPEPFLSRTELADVMGVSTRTIDRWVQEKMPHETWGLRTRVFRASECVRWARQRARRAA